MPARLMEKRMRPPRTSTLVLSALFAFAAAAAAIGPSFAYEDNIATRCGSWGCNVIRCNSTGDRCYRLDGRYGRYGDGYGYGANRYDRYDRSDRYDRRGRYGDNRCSHRHDRGYQSKGYGAQDCGCDEHRQRYGRGGRDDDRYRDDYWQRRGTGDRYDRRY